MMNVERRMLNVELKKRGISTVVENRFDLEERLINFAVLII